MASKTIRTNIATITRNQYNGWYFSYYNGGTTTVTQSNFTSKKAAVEALKVVAPNAEILKVKEFSREVSYGYWLTTRNSTPWHQHCN